MDMEVERAVGNQVWHHEHPWTGRGVDRGGEDPWGRGGDERHFAGVSDCGGVENEV